MSDSSRDTSRLGPLVRARRVELGLTLEEVAASIGCTKGYLSGFETEQRPAPGEELLARLDAALWPKEGRRHEGTKARRHGVTKEDGGGGVARPRGGLVDAARWERAPASIKGEVGRLMTARRSDDAVRRRLSEIMAASATDEQGRIRGSLDDAYRSGELRKLVDRIAPTGEPANAKGPAPVALPLEVPLINKVAAGYPTHFTDLGYPVRSADEYVRCPDIADPDAFACRVVGDSMLPEYREGDIVVFSPARKLASGMDCFARLEPDHESAFKRVYFESGADGREMIRLQPLNSAYPPRVVARESVAGLYAAVTVMRRV